MEYLEALEIVVARTGHVRYRELCDSSHPDHAAWRKRVLALVRGELAPQEASPPNPRLAAQLKLQALVMKCPQRDTSVPCGCGMAVCRLNKGGGIDPTRVALRECEACVASQTRSGGSG